MRTRRPAQPGDGETNKSRSRQPTGTGRNGHPAQSRSGRAGGGRQRQPDRDVQQPESAGRRERRNRTSDLLYGRNAVREALRAGRRRFNRMYVNESAEGGERLSALIALARQRAVPVESVSRQTLDARVHGHHQGVILDAFGYPYAVGDDLRALAEDDAVLLALDGIEDPQNLGTLLRTAEATGVRLVVITANRSAQVTPAVVNASAGAVEHLHVQQEVNLTRWLQRAKEAGFWVVGLASEDAEPLFETSMRPPIVLVVGSEGEGIRRLVRETCDLIVGLPMQGRIESLNAAVAGSIGLYEIVRDADED